MRLDSTTSPSRKDAASRSKTTSRLPLLDLDDEDNDLQPLPLHVAVNPKSRGVAERLSLLSQKSPCAPKPSGKYAASSTTTAFPSPPTAASTSSILSPRSVSNQDQLHPTLRSDKPHKPHDRPNRHTLLESSGVNPPPETGSRMELISAQLQAQLKRDTVYITQTHDESLTAIKSGIVALKTREYVRSAGGSATGSGEQINSNIGLNAPKSLDLSPVRDVDVAAPASIFAAVIASAEKLDVDPEIKSVKTLVSTGRVASASKVDCGVDAHVDKPGTLVSSAGHTSVSKVDCAADIHVNKASITLDVSPTTTIAASSSQNIANTNPKSTLEIQNEIVDIVDILGAMVKSEAVDCLLVKKYLAGLSNAVKSLQELHTESSLDLNNVLRNISKVSNASLSAAELLSIIPTLLAQLSSSVSNFCVGTLPTSKYSINTTAFRVEGADCSQMSSTCEYPPYAQIKLEHVLDTSYYRRHFSTVPHQTYVGNMDKLGAAVVSISTEHHDHDDAYRCILRLESLPESRVVIYASQIKKSFMGAKPVDKLLQMLNKDLQPAKLRLVDDLKVEKRVLALDEIQVWLFLI